MTETAGESKVGSEGEEKRSGPPPDGARGMTDADPARRGRREEGTGQEGTEWRAKEMGDAFSLVPDTAWKRLESQLLVVKGHIRTGAEARVSRGRFLGMDVVIKERYPRSYRARELDDELRKHRLRAEARLLVEARGLGVNTPRVFDLDLTRCILILQYLPFPSLKEVLGTDGIPIPPSPGSPSGSGPDPVSDPAPPLGSDPGHDPVPGPVFPPGSGPVPLCGDPHDRAPLILEAGRLIGVLHAHDIIHGDLTTTNILVEGRGLWFIDFGLAEKTDEVENKGVDLHVFTEAFESTHSALLNLLDGFYAGYREGNPDGGNEVIARAGEIAKRGRYS